MGPSKKNFFSELGSEATYLSLSVNSSLLVLKFSIHIHSISELMILMSQGYDVCILAIL